MKKIGITFEPPENSTAIFSNGIKQNALFLNELLLNIGYDSYLLIPKNSIELISGLYGFDSDKFKYIIWEESTDFGLDVVIQFTFQIELEYLLKFKKSGIKIVAYKCGNDFTLDLQSVLHLSDKERVPQYYLLSDHLPLFDEIWSIPQMVNTNLHYWSTLYKTKAIEVPFIWSPTAMEHFEIDCEKVGISINYRNRGGSKKVAIFEPNIGVIKWFYPALLVCENAYRKIGDKLDFVYVTNIPKNHQNFDIDLTNEIVKSLDLYRDKKISIEARYNSLWFISAHADICVSHQWENPLNYLYLDLAWYGWPVVHNAHLCKDIGYYYDEFNYVEGGRVLEKVIKNHDKNIERYIEKNRRLIDRYLPTNESLQMSYKKLIEELFK
jgi:hypothetical protein